MSFRAKVFPLLFWMSLPCCLSAEQESPALKALAAEPEVIQLSQNYANLQANQNLPYNDIRKPSALQGIFQASTNLVAGRVLIEKLRVRLEIQSDRGRNVLKQQELTELLRYQASNSAVSHSASQAFGATDNTQASRIIRGMVGDNTQETRWEDRTVAEQEAKNAISEHCYRVAKANDLVNCAQTTLGGPVKLAGDHELAWMGCFRSRLGRECIGANCL